MSSKLSVPKLIGDTVTRVFQCGWRPTCEPYVIQTWHIPPLEPAASWRLFHRLGWGQTRFAPCPWKENAYGQHDGEQWHSCWWLYQCRIDGYHMKDGCQWLSQVAINLRMVSEFETQKGPVAQWGLINTLLRGCVRVRFPAVPCARKHWKVLPLWCEVGWTCDCILILVVFYGLEPVN